MLQQIKNKAIFLILILLLAGCSALTTHSRSPFEWITLANSGLSGMDNYTYRAHVEMGINPNIKMSTYNYNGEVHSHHEYTISGDEIDATILHPVKYMDVINNKENNIAQVMNQPDVNTNGSGQYITFQVEESVNNATTRWKSLLYQQFEQVKLNSEHTKSKLSSQQLVDLTTLFEKSEAELKQMLDTLKVESQFFVTINSIYSIPISIEEHATLQYMRDGKQVDEYRISTVELQY